MDELKACADLCERRGFAAQAERLRSVAEGRARAYVVLERPVGEYGIEMGEGGSPLAIYPDQDEAERDARRRNIRAFRARDIIGNYEHRLQWDTDLDAETLATQIGAILGRDFVLPNAMTPRPGPIFPESASDQQMGEIVGLFRDLPFYVVEAEVAG